MLGNRRATKAQSAMEYLMTYGWAILIIAVVLAALFSLGVFSGGNLLGNSCVASPGYSCGSVVLSPQGGLDTLGLALGQNTGVTIGDVQLACGSVTTSAGYPYVSSAYALGGSQSGNAQGYGTGSSASTAAGFANVMPNGVVSANTLSVSGNDLTLISGQTITIPASGFGLPCFSSTGLALTPSNNPVGSSFSGYLWINYTSGGSTTSPGSSGSPWATLKIATVTQKVV